MMPSMETTPDEALTDAQKIEQLWTRLDDMNSANASLRLANEMKDKEIAELKAQVDGYALANARLRDQVQAMAVEVNNASQRAATAVQDYIARQR